MLTDGMQLLRSGMGDCRVIGVAWDDACLLIKAKLAGEDHKIVNLRFHDVVRLRIDMNFGQLSGPGLPWEVTVTEVEQGQRHACFDFGGAPEGFIEFDFSNVTLDA